MSKKTAIKLSVKNRIAKETRFLEETELLSWQQFAPENEDEWTLNHFEKWEKEIKPHIESEVDYGMRRYAFYFLMAMGEHTPENLTWFQDNFTPDVLQYLVSARPFELTFMFPTEDSPFDIEKVGKSDKVNSVYNINNPALDTDQFKDIVAAMEKENLEIPKLTRILFVNPNENEESNDTVDESGAECSGEHSSAE